MPFNGKKLSWYGWTIKKHYVNILEMNGMLRIRKHVKCCPSKLISYQKHWQQVDGDYIKFRYMQLDWKSDCGGQAGTQCETEKIFM
jgi:hypothetical protein